MSQYKDDAVRVIGIDPGSRLTGFGVVDCENNRFKVVEYGVVRLKQVAIAPRLQQIFEQLRALIERVRPDVFAIEQVFVAKNPSSALKLGHARGAAMLAGSICGLEISEYSALQIKKAVVGRGRADKQQVQQMVAMLLNLPELPQSDSADALAVALCHGQSSQLHQQICAQYCQDQTGTQSKLAFRGRLRRT